jgi:hypothetical protein
LVAFVLTTGERGKEKAAAALPVGQRPDMEKFLLMGRVIKRLMSQPKKYFPPFFFFCEKRWKNGPNIRVIPHRIIEN